MILHLIICAGVTELDQIIEVFLKTNMAIAGILAMILDNALPGTDEERGLKKWRAVESSESLISAGKATLEVYDPLPRKFFVGKWWLRYVPFLPNYPLETDVLNKVGVDTQEQIPLANVNRTDIPLNE